MRQLEKKILYIWAISAVIGGFLLSLVPGLLALAFEARWLLPITVMVFPVIGVLYTFLRYRNWRYEVRDDHIYLEHGVLVKTRTMVPFVRIQHIDSQRGALERLTGLSHLVVYTAGSRGADVTVPGLSREDAESLQKKLRDLAIESEGEQGDAV